MHKFLRHSLGAEMLTEPAARIRPGLALQKTWPGPARKNSAGRARAGLRKNLRAGPGRA